MATITPQSASADATLAYVAATSGGDTLAVGLAQHVVLVVRNGAGSSVTVTLAAVAQCNQGFTHNDPIVCAAGTDTPISIPTYCITGAGNVGITYSSVVTVSVAAILA